jgi:hypothetical protein
MEIMKEIHVREVGDRFEFFEKQFTQSHAPKLKCCVPERAQRALSNGILRFQKKMKQHSV